MAGNANVLKSAWPQGEDGIILLELGPFEVEASKTNYVVDALRVPYAFEPVYAEVASHTVTVTNGITLDVLDNESTPQQIVEDHTLAASTAGSTANASMTIDDFGPVLADAVLSVRYTSGASDTSVNTKVRLWVRPVHK